MDIGYDVSTPLDELSTTSQDSEERELFHPVSSGSYVSILTCENRVFTCAKHEKYLIY